jgi:WD40 repeat protein
MMSQFIVWLTLLGGVHSTGNQAEKMIKHVLDIKLETKSDEVYLAPTSDGGRCFVANGQNGHLWEYDTATGKVRQRIETPLTIVRCLQVSPDGTMLAAGGDGLVLLDLKSNNVRFFHPYPDRVNTIAFSPDNKVVVMGTVNKVLKGFSLPVGKEWRSFTGAQFPIMCISFSPDGQEMASGGIDQLIRIWDVRNGSEKKGIPTPLSLTSALSYSYDGRYIAYTGVQPLDPLLDPLDLNALNEIRIWDRKEWKAECTVRETMTRISGLFVSNEAKYVFACSRNGNAIVWERAKTTPQYTTVWTRKDCKALAVSGNFQKMVTADKDGLLSVWDVKLPIVK